MFRPRAELSLSAAREAAERRCIPRQLRRLKGAFRLRRGSAREKGIHARDLHMIKGPFEGQTAIQILERLHGKAGQPSFLLRASPRKSLLIALLNPVALLSFCGFVDERRRLAFSEDAEAAATNKQVSLSSLSLLTLFYPRRSHLKFAFELSVYGFAVKAKECEARLSIFSKLWRLSSFRSSIFLRNSVAKSTSSLPDTWERVAELFARGKEGPSAKLRMQFLRLAALFIFEASLPFWSAFRVEVLASDPSRFVECRRSIECLLELSLLALQPKLLKDVFVSRPRVRSVVVEKLFGGRDRQNKEASEKADSLLALRGSSQTADVSVHPKVQHLVPGENEFLPSKLESKEKIDKKPLGEAGLRKRNAFRLGFPSLSYRPPSRTRVYRMLGGALVESGNPFYALTVAMMRGMELSNQLNASLMQVAHGEGNRLELGFLLDEPLLLDLRHFHFNCAPLLPASYSCCFEDIAPDAFECAREAAGISEQAYRASLCSTDFSFIEFQSNSKSGQFFFFSHDGKFLIKTISKAEVKQILRILPAYVDHVLANPLSLLTRIFGIHRVELRKERNSNSELRPDHSDGYVEENGEAPAKAPEKRRLQGSLSSSHSLKQQLEELQARAERRAEEMASASEAPRENASSSLMGTRRLAPCSRASMWGVAGKRCSLQAFAADLLMEQDFPSLSKTTSVKDTSGLAASVPYTSEQPALVESRRRTSRKTLTPTQQLFLSDQASRQARTESSQSVRKTRTPSDSRLFAAVAKLCRCDKDAAVAGLSSESDSETVAPSGSSEQVMTAAYFIAMGTAFDPALGLHEAFDLKGSTVSRRAKATDKVKKDVDWLARGQRLCMREEDAHMFLAAHERDCRFLEQQGVFDYSLLVGIHRCKRDAALLSQNMSLSLSERASSRRGPLREYTSRCRGAGPGPECQDSSDLGGDPSELNMEFLRGSILNSDGGSLSYGQLSSKGGLGTSPPTANSRHEEGTGLSRVSLLSVDLQTSAAQASTQSLPENRPIALAHQEGLREDSLVPETCAVSVGREELFLSQRIHAAEVATVSPDEATRGELETQLKIAQGRVAARLIANNKGGRECSSEGATLGVLRETELVLQKGKEEDVDADAGGQFSSLLVGHRIRVSPVRGSRSASLDEKRLAEAVSPQPIAATTKAPSARTTSKCQMFSASGLTRPPVGRGGSANVNAKNAEDGTDGPSRAVYYPYGKSIAVSRLRSQNSTPYLGAPSYDEGFGMKVMSADRREIFYFGIIDFLNPYTSVRYFHTAYKRFKTTLHCEGGEISPMPPSYYARRQVAFVKSQVISAVPSSVTKPETMMSGEETRLPGSDRSSSDARARRRRHSTWLNIYAYLQQHHSNNRSSKEQDQRD